MDVLWVKEPPLLQTPNERIIYTYDTTEWVDSPTSSSVKAYDESASDTDVTSTVFPTNSPSESDNVITLSLLRELTLNHVYRLEIKFTVGDAKYEIRDRVKCVRYYVMGGPANVSASEEMPLKFTTTAWGSSPTSPTVTAYDQNQGDKDVTTTVFPTNEPSTDGNVITTSPIKSLTARHSYRVNCKFTISTEIFDPSLIVKCPF